MYCNETHQPQEEEEDDDVGSLTYCTHEEGGEESHGEEN